MKVKVGRKLDSLNEVLQELRGASDNVGALIAFVGVVRGETKTGERVLRLEYEAHPQLAQSRLSELIEDVKEKHGIIDAVIEHRVGEALVGEEVMLVAVASKHRKEGFQALIELVNRVKREVPIWKKEVTERGAYWVESSK